MSRTPQDTFFEEANELLQGMEDALLALENSPEDPELINAIFRAAHTIKGTGGVFGFEHVQAFTHVAENVLDKLRDGEITVDNDLIALLLNCRDHIAQLVDSAVNEEEIPNETVMSKDAELIAGLKGYLNIDTPKADEPNQLPEDNEQISNEHPVSNDEWHISLRFEAEVLQNGMDPLSFLRYLKKIGTLTSVTTLLDGLPGMDELNPELCYLGFEINLESDTDKEEIENVFEFVQDLAQIQILPPRANIQHYAKMIESLPGEEQRLGEILVQSGALTALELQEVLELQHYETMTREKPLLGDLLVDKKHVHKEVVDVALQKQDKTSKRNASRGSLRVDADKLDELINLVGELVISGATTNLQARRLADEKLLESTSHMSRLVELIRDNALTLRMIPIGETFNRFQRVVRDVSKELGKDIKLEIEGADTELDKTVVDALGDPLMHIVRNAMDHGIESTEERKAAGKPEQGTLRLKAFHDAGNIVIEISDDGKGLSKERIIAKATEKGLIEAHQNLSDQEIYHLIFEAGFSTAEQVTNLSGRGVGMDVVRTNIEALRGSVDVNSQAGEGTTISIRLPLTLAIIDGFLVGVGGTSYVIPLDMVTECIELGSEELQSLQHDYLNLRGGVLPYLRLRDTFNDNQQDTEHESIVIVQYGNQQAGLVVDELLGELQAVIKPMGNMLKGVKGVIGTTILGSGEVAVILDVYNLIQKASVAKSNLGVGAQVA